MPNPHNPKERCVSCRFFDKPQSSEKKGHCLRFPPQVIFAGGSRKKAIFSYFPKLEPDNWCGEWEILPEG
jgi:hypothetical protein